MKIMKLLAYTIMFLLPLQASIIPRTVAGQGQSDVRIIIADSEIDTESEFIEALFFAYDT